MSYVIGIVALIVTFVILIASLIGCCILGRIMCSHLRTEGNTLHVSHFQQLDNHFLPVIFGIHLFLESRRCETLKVVVTADSKHSNTVTKPLAADLE